MHEHVLAATTIGALKTQVREYPFPAVPPDGGTLRVEAAGVCGGDWQAYQADRPVRIVCHGIVGRIFRIGPTTARFGLANEDLAVRPVCRQGAPGAVHVAVLPWN
jgi:D-arabinose 1-dehydrogenase-like Zn-dependent alcohol dehydrogenase